MFSFNSANNWYPTVDVRPSWVCRVLKGRRILGTNLKPLTSVFNPNIHFKCVSLQTPTQGRRVHRSVLYICPRISSSKKKIAMKTSSKKSLKIPKGKSESVYRRRTDNTMPKRKGTKDKQRFTKHKYKTKDRVTRTPLKSGVKTRVLRKGEQFLLH